MDQFAGLDVSVKETSICICTVKQEATIVGGLAWATRCIRS
jgi:hypothetical protein